MFTVYTYLVMDILHFGHLRMLEKAKQICDANDGILIAGILTDEAAMERKDKPVFSFEHRMEIADSISFIGKVVAQTTYSPRGNVIKLRPNILIESNSHTEDDIAHSENLMAQIGGRVELIPYLDGVSSTLIKAKIRGELDQKI